MRAYAAGKSKWLDFHASGAVIYIFVINEVLYRAL